MNHNTQLFNFRAFAMQPDVQIARLKPNVVGAKQIVSRSQDFAARKALQPVAVFGSS